MTSLTFEPWPKINRLYRPVIITEKIDGTNAAVVIAPVKYDGTAGSTYANGSLLGGKFSDPSQPGIVYNGYVVYAQSRRKVIAPGKERDNYGFASWVRENAEELVEKLGEGCHFGEWCGKGIQSGYGLDRKWFALFNAKRWQSAPLPEGVTTVPILYEGPFSDKKVAWCLEHLQLLGSMFAGYHGGDVRNSQEAEGVVVYFTQANTSFKVTLKDDAMSKGEAAARAKADSQ